VQGAGGEYGRPVENPKLTNVERRLAALRGETLQGVRLDRHHFEA
jgi:hypothetical protein